MSFLYCLRVSSKFRVGGSTNNFEITLDPPINTSQDCCAFVSQASIPVTWETFVAGVNDQLVFAFEFFNFPQIMYQIIPVNITPGFYDGDTFAQYLEAQLNSICDSIIEGGNPSPWNVSLLENGKLSLAWGTTSSPGLSWCLLPASAIGNFLPSQVPGFQIPGTYTGKLANHTIGLYSEVDQVMDRGNPLVCDGIYNALRTHAVYIHSSLSTFSSQGPAPSDRDVICRVPISVPWGFISHFQDSGNSNIMFPVGNQSYSKLRFWVTDSAGAALDLQNQDVELEVWFWDRP
jgi:hypothetical protein